MFIFKIGDTLNNLYNDLIFHQTEKIPVLIYDNLITATTGKTDWPPAFAVRRTLNANGSGVRD